MTDSFEEWDAAYLLGMLSADDRRRFEQHLTSCERCQTAVAELAGVPGILSALSSDEAQALLTGAPLSTAGHVPSLTASLASRVRRARLRRRLLTGAAAVVIAAVLTTTGLAIGRSNLSYKDATSASSAPLVAMAAVGTPVMTAQLSATPESWGTHLAWNCQYTSQSGYSDTGSYDLVVTSRTGDVETVASWNAAGGSGASGLSASTALPLSQIASIDIRLSGSARPLVQTNL